jgi:hypothetical protein
MGIPNLSPAVTVNEYDFTLTARAIPQTSGAIAGHFQWGPVERRILIDSEVNLTRTFFYPNDATAKSWFTASSFLAYATGLWVSRANGAGHFNATASGTPQAIKNEGVYEATILNTGLGGAGMWAARYMGELGNSLRVSICPGNTAFESRLSYTGNILVANATVLFTGNTLSDPAGALTVGDYINFTGNANTGYIEVIGIDAPGRNVTVTQTSATAAFNVANGAVVATRRWRYAQYFPSAPTTSEYVAAQGGANDEVHIAVVDKDGKFSGVANTVLEAWPYVSVASDAQNKDGSTNFYKQVLFQKSQYIYWTGYQPGGTNWGQTANGTVFAVPVIPNYASLAGGNTGTPNDGHIVTALAQFQNPEEVDISFIMMADASSTAVQYAIQSIAEIRYDCIVTFSPRLADVVETPGNELTNIINYAQPLYHSAFGVMDSGWKYMFDRYNNVYRYVPLNGDIAGLMARTLNPWDSPAGPNKGLIKNAIKVAWNPTKAQRDELFRRGINPVVTFPGEGIQLFGDKTFLTKNSAFDHINVRRLFSYIEKVIAKAARSSLFELNDEFTRARFVSLVEPFLRDVMGKRGIYDFRVVCDETNNTGQVIDQNQFVGDIYVKPARSINDIQLNYIATPTGVTFDEIIGRFGG